MGGSQTLCVITPWPAHYLNKFLPISQQCKHKNVSIFCYLHVTGALICFPGNQVSSFHLHTDNSVMLKKSHFGWLQEQKQCTLIEYKKFCWCPSTNTVLAGNHGMLDEGSQMQRKGWQPAWKKSRQDWRKITLGSGINTFDVKARRETDGQQLE